jgi:O-methyltransferase
MRSIVTTNRSRGALKRVWLQLPYSHRLEYAVALPKLRVWAAERADGVPVFMTRRELFADVAAAAGHPSVYLEFGVAGGGSMRAWAEADSDPRSVLIGLDTFTGLPEAWTSWRIAPPGKFNAGGIPPVIDDSRVSFRIGLFQETLPGLLRELPELLRGRALVVHMDADLHSSTIYALTQLDPFLPGAIVVFDEWANPMHEFRALHDYCSAYRRDYEVLAVWRHLRKVALRIKGSPSAGERKN